MNWLYARAFKVISFVVLFFFTWTSGGLFQVAYAVKDSKESGVQSSESKKAKPEGKLQKALEEIEGVLTDAATDTETKKNKLKTKKTEIGNIDVEIKKQFKETEDKIKDLPGEIKQRHKDFVKKYEDNLKELRTNLDDIDKAKTKGEKEEAHRKAKEFLDKAKPPKKHTPLDPNNLPHRTAEPVFVEPRTSPEQFLEELSTDARKSNSDEVSEAVISKMSFPLVGNPSAIPNKSERLRTSRSDERSILTGKRGFDKPILVASNGSLNGILSDSSKYTSNHVIPVPDYDIRGQVSTGRSDSSHRLASGIQSSGYPIETFGYDKGSSSSAAFDFDSPDSQRSTPNLLLAAATPPSTADLSETIEVQFTPEITAKAEELGNNPVKIYEYVRNNFEYEPYYGSLKGAQQTLLEMAGNDFDQASLLIALLRLSNIPARYVYGTVEIPIEKLMNWAGGVTDPNTAATILATAGIPGKLLTEGGQIKYAQMEHVWVEAYVPYGNYRGAIRDDSMKTWIPLDPSFKQLSEKNGLDFYAALNFNGESFLLGYISNINSSTPYQVFSEKLKAYLDTNVPNYDLEEILGDVKGFVPSTNIISKQYPYLLGSLPYKVIVKGAIFASIPDNLRHKIKIQISNHEGTDISYSAATLKFINHRVTISYEPATQNDENLANRYGDILKVPPYLIQIKSVLRVDGAKVASGISIGLGDDQVLNISFITPPQRIDLVQNTITTGIYAAITIIPGNVMAEFSGGRMEQFWANLYKIPSNDITRDDIVGEMLYNIGLTYFGQVSFQEALYASTFNMLLFRQPSEAIITAEISVDYLFGVPFSIAGGGLSIDVDRNLHVPFSKNGDARRTKDFMMIAGVTSSAWEDKILEFMYGEPGVSAIKLLQYSSSQGIPIYNIDKTNIDQIMPLLQFNQDLKSEIKNAVNANKKVVIPGFNIQYLNWYGTGYIILDPVKGAGAYMISGGLSGGWSNAEFSAYGKDSVNDVYARLCPSLRQKIVMTAFDYLGTPYRRNGKTPEEGFDCSGLAYYVYKIAGISILKGRAIDQYNNSTKTDYPLIGDLVFFGSSRKTIHHVGIIIGEDVEIDAPKPGDFVKARFFQDFNEPFYFGTYVTKTCP